VTSLHNARDAADQTGRAVVTSGIEAEFDAKAPTYESNRLAGWYKAQNEAVLKAIGPVTGTVVDVGCGTGWLLRELAKRNPQADGIGVDLSGRMILNAEEQARAAQPDRLAFVRGDWEDPCTQQLVKSLLARPASAVVCVSALHYFQDPAGAVRGMVDLLGRDGRIILLDRAMDASLGTRFWDLLHRHVIRDGAQFYRTDELLGTLRSAGCQDVTVVERISRLFWQGKMHTSLSLVRGVRRSDSESSQLPGDNDDER
jgi:SAM-dependent methyltransferase